MQLLFWWIYFKNEQIINICAKLHRWFSKKWKAVKLQSDSSEEEEIQIMTGNNPDPQLPTNLYPFIESLTPIRISDKFRGKDFTILLIVEDRDNAKYEMLIRNQKLEIVKGDLQKPDISMEGFEEDFIKVFHKMDPYSMATLKNRGPIFKHITLTTFIGEINLFLENRDKPAPEISEADESKRTSRRGKILYPNTGER